MLEKLYKLLFDVSLCYAIGAFLLSYLLGITIYGGGFLFLAGSILLAVVIKEKHRWGLLSMIITPFPYLFTLSPTVWDSIVYVLIWVYLIFVLRSERYMVSRDNFVERLKQVLFCSLLLMLPMAISFKRFIPAMQISSLYLIGASISAVFLLRHLRALNQIEQRKEYQWQQFIEFSAFLVICLILTLIKAPQNLLFGLNQIYSNLVVPAITYLATLIVMLIYGIFNLLIGLIEFITNKKIEKLELNYDAFIQQPELISESDTKDVSWLIPFLYCVGAILGFVLLLKLYRWLMGEKFQRNIPSGIQETREYVADVKSKKSSKRKMRPRNPRSTVRYYYVKYLLMLSRSKVVLNPQDTTEKIQEKHLEWQKTRGKTDIIAAKDLKQLYRKARYGMEEEISKEEAEGAKKLYKEINNN